MRILLSAALLLLAAEIASPQVTKQLATAAGTAVEDAGDARVELMKKLLDHEKDSASLLTSARTGAEHTMASDLIWAARMARAYALAVNSYGDIYLSLDSEHRRMVRPVILSNF